MLIDHRLRELSTSAPVQPDRTRYAVPLPDPGY
jgi:hypothetical protein